MKSQKRTKFKESSKSKPIDLSGIKVIADVEPTMFAEKVEVLLEQKEVIKFSDFRRIRALLGLAMNNNASGVECEIVWDFIFKHFDVQCEVVFEQTDWNLGFVAGSIFGEVYKVIAENKKK